MPTIDEAIQEVEFILEQYSRPPASLRSPMDAINDLLLITSSLLAAVKQLHQQQEDQQAQSVHMGMVARALAG